jgi:hypothetical protein
VVDPLSIPVVVLSTTAAVQRCEPRSIVTPTAGVASAADGDGAKPQNTAEEYQVE